MKRPVVAALAAGLASAAVAPAAAWFTPNLHLVSGASSPVLKLQDVEPAIRVDTTGRIFVSAIHGVPAGTDLFQVAPNGLSFAYRGMPDGLPVFNPTGLAPGGGDTDEAIGSFAAVNGVAPVPGSLLITSLNLGTVYSSQTSNAGNTYTPGGNAAGGFFGVDRQWNAAQGGLERYNVTHDLATGNVQFSKSMDGGLTWINGTPTTYPVAATATQDNELGSIVVDGVHHILYEVFVSVANANENASALPLHTVWVAKSTDDGTTWTDTIAYNGPATASYNHLFPTIAVDYAGNIYVAWSDDKNVFLAYSTNRGASWSASVAVTGPGTNSGYATHIFPWLAAGGNGGVDLVYYETQGANSSLATDRWSVGFAENRNVPGSPTSWIYGTPSDHIIHTGQVCENGIGCDSTQPGNRNLADDFQIALDPQGLANIAYTDDHDTSIPPQVYFVKQTHTSVLGAAAGAPNVEGPNHGCVADDNLAGHHDAMRLKAPEYNTPGWLTVVVNRQLALAGPVRTFVPSSPSSGTFAGTTLRGVPFHGSVTNGNLSVIVGTKTLTVTNDSIRNGDACLMAG